MNKRIFLILSLVVLWSTTYLFAQSSLYNEPWRWAHFSTNEGLPSNRVLGILEQPNGVAWVNTSDGLAYFNNFYWIRMGASKGVPEKRADIFLLNHDGNVVAYLDGKIFVGNSEGFKSYVLRYNGVTVQPYNIASYGNHQYLAIHPDEKLYVWNDDFTQCKPYESVLPKEPVYRVWNTESGNVWIESRYGLYCIEDEIPILKMGPSKYTLNVSDVVEDSIQGGYAYVNYPQDMIGFWVWEPHQKPRNIKEGLKHQIVSVAIKKSCDPIYVYNFGEVRTFHKNAWSSISPLPKEMNDVVSFLYRNNGDLWVATESGLNLFRSSISLWTYLKQSPFKSNMIGDLLLTHKGALWVATDSGLIIYQPDGAVKTIASVLGQPLTGLTGLTEDSEKNIWVSSGQRFAGAYKWNGSQWSYFGAEQGLPCLIHKIIKDREGRLWFLGIGKYYEYTTQDPGAFLYKNGKFIRWGTKEGLQNGRVYSFAEGKDSAYWFGTNGGLSRWKQGEWQYWNVNTGLLADKIFALAVDSNNTVWFSHQYKGLGYLQEGKPYYVNLTEKHIVDAIWQLAVDSLNTVWATTTNGLLSIDHGVISHYGKNVGLSPTRLWPIIFARDKIYLGTFGGGVAIMNLEALDDTPPLIVLSGPIVEKKSVLFRWQAFSYMGQQETHSIETRYRLNEDEWSDWTEQREKVYFELPSGSHTFTVQARNTVGKVVPIGASVVVSIERPYYLQADYLIPVITLSGSLLVLGIILLVRKRKHNLELQLSEERYRGIIQDQTDLLCRYYSDGRILFVNEAFCSYFHTTKEKATGRKFQEFIPEKGVEYEPIKEYSPGDPTKSFNQKIHAADGSVRWLNVIERAFFEKTKKVVEVQAVARDITESQIMEEALRQSEKDYRGLFENSQDAIIIYNPDTRVILDANHHAFELYGVNREEFIGASYEKITNHTYLAKEQIHDKLLGGFHDSFETILDKKDRSIVYIEVNTSVVQYKGKSVVLSIHRDISERKISELAIIRREAILEALSFSGQQFIQQGELEEKIQTVIMKLGRATNVSRVYIVEHVTEGSGALIGRVKKEWTDEEMFNIDNHHQWKHLNYKESGLERWIEVLTRGMEIHGNIKDFPILEQKILLTSGIKSILIMPIMVKKNCWGFIGVDDCLHNRVWSSAEIDALSVTANILGTVLERQMREKVVDMLAQAIRGISECVSVTDLENTLIFVNGAFCSTYGYDESELLGKSIDIVRSYDKSVLDSKILPSTLAGSWQGELFNKKKDGTVFPIFLSTSVVKDGAGNPVALIGIAKDITEQKRIERQLREQASLLTITTDAIIVTDINQIIMYWNPGAERLYGWEASSVIGKNINNLLAIEKEHIGKKIWGHVLAEGEWRGELKQKTKEDKEIIVDSRSIVIRDEEAHPISILIVNTDITEKKIMQEQFLRSQRLESIGTLAGGIAHDLNNVLAPILLSVDILKRRFPDEATQDLLQALHTSAIRGKDIIKQVLTFARGVGGEYSVLQPKHLVKEMDNIMHETFPKMLNINVHVQNDLWTITADPTQIHQVLLNLCLNARDAMPSGGTLALDAENVIIGSDFVRTHLNAKEGKYVSFRISDTGTGIPPETLDKIFDPFFTTKDIGKGTGLGLSTVHALIKGHGGFVTVESKIGHGSIFSVYLPVSDLQGELPVKALEQQYHKGNNEQILVVDDEEAILEIARQTLEYSGYRVLTAKDGTEAIALYLREQNDIKLVLTDIHMPYMDGISLIRSLRQIQPSLKIIAASGQGADIHFLGAAEIMVQGFIPKPFTAGDLLDTISLVLHSSN